MPARFRVKGDVARTGFREIRHESVDGLHHEMNVDRRLDTVIPERLANHGANREIRDEMIVHDIEMHDVGTGIQHGADIVAEACEVGGKYRRSYQWRHGMTSAEFRLSGRSPATEHGAGRAGGTVPQLARGE